MAQPRTLSDFEPLTAAERQVLAGLDTGEVTVLGDGTLPGEHAGDDRRLRARFVRWVVLGCEGSDEHRLHEKGLQVRGALIVGDGPEGAETRGLDLEGCRLEHDLVLFACRFADAPLLRGARLRSLFLNDSALPGLSADGLAAEGDVFLSGATVTGEVRLLGARVGGDLACDGARLSNDGGKALNADRLSAEGGVFLRGATVTGEVRLLGAQAGGDLDCDGARLSNDGGEALSADGLSAEGGVFLSGATVTGEVRLLGARVGGDLACGGARLSNDGGKALSADGARIEGGFFLRAGAAGEHARIEGVLDLTGAVIGRINDHPGSWPKGAGSLALNRCVYGAFTGHGVSAEERLRWLGLQDPSRYRKEFQPQPWEQCAKVFREMGHAEDARAILIDKERRQRAARRARERDPEVRAFRWLWDMVLAVTVRYGRRPLFATLWLFGFWLFGTSIYLDAWRSDAFKPNNPVILRSAEWLRCAHGVGETVELAAPGQDGAGALRLSGLREPGHGGRLDCFMTRAEGAGYPDFNAAIYSLDVLFPLVDIEQQEKWVPDDDTPDGRTAKAVVYTQIIMGWLLSLLAVAGLSGLVKSD